jgi:hypothetical protein
MRSIGGKQHSVIIGEIVLFFTRSGLYGLGFRDVLQLLSLI